MKKLIVLSVMLVIVSSCVLAAATVKPVVVAKPKVVVTPVVVPVVVAPKPAMLLSVNGGLAAGGGKIGLSVQKPINERFDITGDLGFTMGNGYSVAIIGASLKMPVREKLNAGLMLNYSSYSQAVNIPGVGDITTLGGVGLGIYAEYMVMERINAQLGYDTRLGTVAQVAYVFKN